MSYPKKIVLELAMTLLQGLCISHPTEKQSQAAEEFIRSVILPMNKDLMTQVKLAPKEWLCLNLAASGFSIEETAEKLSLASGTVRNYRERIREKFQCRTITQAVYKAFFQEKEIED